MTTAAGTADDVTDAPPAADTSARSRRLTIIAWIGAALVFAYILVPIATDDFRAGPLIGDQSNFLLQSLSIVRSHNLSYDTNDQAAWASVGWTPYPDGLFSQKRDDGWAFAKPYGYSVWMSPFIRAFSVRMNPPMAPSPTSAAGEGFAYAINAANPNAADKVARNSSV